MRPLFSMTLDLGDEHGLDHLFGLDEEFAIGPLRARAIAVPGHTPADMAFLIGVAMRATRDLTLKVRTLQVNLRGGRLPASDHNGLRYMRTPIDEAHLVEDAS